MISLHGLNMHYLEEELYARIQADRQVFDFIQMAALDGLWYWDLTAPEHEWMNPRFWTCLGYDPNQMPHLAEAWQSIIFPEDLAIAKEAVQRHLQDPDKYPYDQILRYRHRKGHTVWIRCRGCVWYDAEGRPARMLGAHVDVSEAKERELLHQKERDFLHSILDAQHTYICRIGLDGNYNYVNRKMEEDFEFFYARQGQSPIGKPAKDSVLPEEILKLKEVLVALQENPQAIVRKTLRKRHREGFVAATLWEFRWIQKDTPEIQGIGIDYTQELAAQKNLERNTLLLNDAQRIARMGAWELDSSTGRTFWTDEVYRIHEVDLDFDHNKENGIAFYHPDDQPRIREAIQN
ncbi:MAG: PAS domain-containing protein, partial [Bernardetiaceae bacterium]